MLELARNDNATFTLRKITSYGVIDIAILDIQKGPCGVEWNINLGPGKYISLSEFEFAISRAKEKYNEHTSICK